MKYLLLGAPLALAACGTIPCPVPVTCSEPFGCVCLVTGAVDPLPDGDGWTPASAPTAQPQPTTPPDHNGGQTKDDSNGHGSSDGSTSSDGGKSDE